MSSWVKYRRNKVIIRNFRLRNVKASMVASRKYHSFTHTTRRSNVGLVYYLTSVEKRCLNHVRCRISFLYLKSSKLIIVTVFACCDIFHPIPSNFRLQKRLRKCKRRIARFWRFYVAWSLPLRGLSFVEPICLRRIIKSLFCSPCPMKIICDASVRHRSSDHTNSLFMLILV